MTRLVNGLRMAIKMLRPRIWCGSFYESLKSINNLAERQIRRLSQKQLFHLVGTWRKICGKNVVDIFDITSQWPKSLPKVTTA